MATCRTITCCEPGVAGYRADANPAATVPNSGGCPVASVVFNPADGSFVIFPTLVALGSNVAGAVIYYTLDGSDPTDGTTYALNGPEATAMVETGGAGAWDDPPHGNYWQVVGYSYRDIGGVRHYAEGIDFGVNPVIEAVNASRSAAWVDGAGAEGVRLAFYDHVSSVPVFVGTVDVPTGIGFYESLDPADLTGPEVFTPVFTPNPEGSTSVLYTQPFPVLAQNVTVRARAYVAGCDAGPIASATFQAGGENFAFSYLCETGDKVGVFDEFAANGSANDYQFVLQFTLAALTEILDITILQTDATGFWSSGQSWSTNEWIYPFPDPNIPFHTYPLVIIDQAGPTQLFTDYQTTLGSFGAGAREWRLWGQPFTSLNGYFQLTITLGDGTQIKRLINTTCTEGTPNVCTAPTTPTMTAACAPSVSVTFTVGADAAWRLYRRPTDGGCGEMVWSLVATGTADGTGVVVQSDTEVFNCCSYEYYVSRLCNGVYYDSAVSAAILVPCLCVIELSQSATEVCLGDSVTLVWDSGGCTVMHLFANDAPLGEVEFSGELEVSPTEETEYRLTGDSNGCGESSASVTVTIKKAPLISSVIVDPAMICPPGTVLVSWIFSASNGVPTSVTVNGAAASPGLTGSLSVAVGSVPFAIEVCGTNECGSSCGSVTVADGSLCPVGQPASLTLSYPDTDDFFCSGSTFPNPGATGPVLTQLGSGCSWEGWVSHWSGPQYYRTGVGFVPCQGWLLDVAARSGSGSGIDIWTGRKTGGTTPAGTYTKISGCPLGPATLTIS